MKHSLAVVLFCALSCAVFSEVRITEIMQSNIDGIVDDSNEFPDSWVELYNDGDEAVNLKDYQLGDGPKAKKACNLPNYSLAGHKYAIIYCDKDEDKGAWHMSFRLESGKDGIVYLFKNKEPIDSLVEIPKMPAPNISYGRAHENDKVGFFRHATPYATNEDKVYKKDKILPDPVFSTPGQVYTKEGYHSIKISVPEDAPVGTYLKFTTNGSMPAEENGTRVEESTFLNINKSTVVRARLFHEDYLSPMACTESYLFLGHETDMPIISLVGDEKYWYDDKFGILVEGSYVDWQENFKFDWRRPVALEFFEGTKQEAVLHQLCETRVHGNASRGFGLKSMAVYANKRFGEKRLEYEFFPDQKPGLTNFKSIILHNAGNDFDYLYFRDAFMQKSMALYQDMDWMASRATIVFINGQYKGILTIRERSNEDHIFSNYNELEDITMIENWGELKVGDWNQWAELKGFMGTSGHSYAEYEKMIDVAEFINYEIVEMFYGNVDWPGNNIVWWRPLNAETGYKPVWRLLAKDMDYGFGIYDMSADYNMFEFLYNPDYDKEHNWANRPEHTAFFRYAMEDETYREEYINRALVYLGDFLQYDRLVPMLDAMVNAIQPEYTKYHRPMYNQWWPNYTDEYRKAITWLRQRPAAFVKHMGSRYGQGKAERITLTFEDAENATVTINGIELSQAQWDGYWFVGREMNLHVSWADGTQKQVRIETSSLPLTKYVDKSETDLEKVHDIGCSIKSQNRKIWSENGVKMVVNGKAINVLGQQL